MPSSVQPPVVHEPTGFHVPPRSVLLYTPPLAKPERVVYNVPPKSCVSVTGDAKPVSPNVTPPSVDLMMLPDTLRRPYRTCGSSRSIVNRPTVVELLTTVQLAPLSVDLCSPVIQHGTYARPGDPARS